MTRTRRCASTPRSSDSRRRLRSHWASSAGSTVTSPEDPNGTELVLEPDSHPAARPFKEALVADGLPFTSFAVADVHREFARLQGLGLRFTQEAADMGPVTPPVFEDTAGHRTTTEALRGRP